MKNLLLSVVTVSYNSDNTIEQTIQSVLNQTYKDIEYIIVDGKSTDKTLEIIKKYENDFNGRLKWISEKDNGIYDAMNKGIAMANGEFVGIINSDDWYEENALENMIKFFKKFPESDIIYGRLKSIYEFGQKKYFIETDQPLNLSVLKKGKTIHHPAVFVKNKIYKKYGMYNLDYKLAADYDFFLRMYLNGVNFTYCDQLFSYFRAGGASNNSLKLINEYNSIKKKYGFYNYSDLLQYYKVIKNIFPKTLVKYLLILKWKFMNKKFKVYKSRL